MTEANLHSLKRFDLEHAGSYGSYGGQMVEVPTPTDPDGKPYSDLGGEWVRFEDVAKLVQTEQPASGTSVA